MNVSYIKELINEYYKGYPWFSVDEKEISIEDFIIINLEEKAYEENQISKLEGLRKRWD